MGVEGRIEKVLKILVVMWLGLHVLITAIAFLVLYFPVGLTVSISLIVAVIYFIGFWWLSSLIFMKVLSFLDKKNRGGA